jgi:hypothetical protein
MPYNLIVIAKDANNVTVPETRSFSLTCSDPKAIMPTAPILTLNSNGFGSYSVYFGTTGAQSVTATDVIDNTSKTTITVNAVPIHLNVSVSPTSITANQSVAVTVTALDSSENILTDIGNQGYGSVLSFASTDPQAIFPSTGGPAQLVNGSAIVNITLATAGSQTITVINKSFPNVNATTNSITVLSLPTATPIVSPSPSTINETLPTATPNMTSNSTVTPTIVSTVTPTSPSTTEGKNGTSNQLSPVFIIIASIAITVIIVVAVLLLFVLGKKRLHVKSTSTLFFNRYA